MLSDWESFVFVLYFLFPSLLLFIPDETQWWNVCGKQATSWKLDEAIQLFYVGNEGGVVASASESPTVENVDSLVDQNSGLGICNSFHSKSSPNCLFKYLLMFFIGFFNCSVS